MPGHQLTSTLISMLTSSLTLLHTPPITAPHTHRARLLLSTTPDVGVRAGLEGLASAAAEDGRGSGRAPVAGAGCGHGHTACTPCHDAVSALVLSRHFCVPHKQPAQEPAYKESKQAMPPSLLTQGAPVGIHHLDLGVGPGYWDAADVPGLTVAAGGWGQGGRGQSQSGRNMSTLAGGPSGGA